MNKKRETGEVVPNFLKRPEGAPNAQQYRELASALEEFTTETVERVRSEGVKKIDRQRLNAAFTDRGFDVKDFSLNEKRSDADLLLRLEEVYDDILVMAELDELYGDKETIELFPADEAFRRADYESGAPKANWGPED